MSSASPELESPTRLLGVAAGELVLRIRGPVRNGQVVRLASQKCTVGSASNCTLRLRLPGVREVHCVILRGATGTVVRRWAPDTRLNGAAFNDAPLKVGDRLAVGPLEFEVLADGGPWLPPGLKRETEQAPSPSTEPSVSRRLEAAVSGSSQRTKRLIEKLDGAKRSVAELEGLAAARQAQLAAFADRLTQLEARTRAAEAIATTSGSTTAAATTSVPVATEPAPFDDRLVSLVQAVGELQAEMARERVDREDAATRLREELSATRIAWEQAAERLAGLTALPAPTLPAAVVTVQESASLFSAEPTALPAQFEQRVDELSRQDELLAERSRELEARARELDARAEQLRGDETELGRRRGELAEQQLRFEHDRQTSERSLADRRQEIQWEATRLDNKREEISVRQKLWEELRTHADSPPVDEASPGREAEQRLLNCETPANPSNTPVEQSSPPEAEPIASEHPADVAGSTEPSSDEVAEPSLADIFARFGILTETGPIDPVACEAAATSSQPVAAVHRLKCEPTNSEIPVALRSEDANLSFHAGIQQEEAATQPEEPPASSTATAVEEAPASESTPDVDEQIRRIREMMAHADQSEPIVNEQRAETLPVIDRAEVELDTDPQTLKESFEDAPVQEEPASAASYAAPPAPAHATDGDEESIEDYMARLLQRMQGGPEAARPVPAPPAPSLRASMGLEHKPENPALAPPPAQPLVVKVMDASEFVPRAAAPEKTSGLEAMRALANHSARSAIENSNKRKGGQEGLFKLFYAAVSGLIGLGVMAWLGWNTVLGGIFGGVGLVLAVLWTMQGVFFYQQVAAPEAEAACGPSPAAAPTTESAASGQEQESSADAS